MWTSSSLAMVALVGSFGLPAKVSVRLLGCRTGPWGSGGCGQLSYCDTLFSLVRGSI